LPRVIVKAFDIKISPNHCQSEENHPGASLPRPAESKLNAAGIRPAGLHCSRPERIPCRKVPPGLAQKKELTMDHHDVIATLNNLLETSRDGEQGFRTCAEGVESPNLKAMFESASRRCAGGAAELEAQIRSLGGQPAQGGSISGSMHRAWTNIKSTITGMNEHAVLAECERGEDAAKAAYEAALQKSLPADVRTLVQRQYEGVKANHDRVRNLRNAAA
jgi:uncharacterized protein (TIGR02284 family)